MARELFVYWKVGREQAHAAHAAAGELLHSLNKLHPHLQARLMSRADEAGNKAGDQAGDQATFMETYSALPAGVTLTMQADIEAQARLSFAPLGHPARHVEVFESLDA